MEDWRERAACKGMDPELWFPVAHAPKDPVELRRIRIAKEACAGCPVRLECLAYAMAEPERFGIWGGMTERERRGRKGRRIRQQVLASA